MQNFSKNSEEKLSRFQKKKLNSKLKLNTKLNISLKFKEIKT